jgi:UDP:flavonoid glycosyltransferase YjiC (YdhE family)
MEKLSAFFDELLNAGTPFLWAHASKIMTPPAELLAKIDASPNATHSNWIPQRAVLHHPGTGWFVSHGGWNSVQEALAFRVPLCVYSLLFGRPSLTPS